MDIRYLILSLTTRCNLRCQYCYYGNPGSPAEMPVTVMKRAMSMAAAGGQHFHLQITGGEPTLVPSLIDKAARLAYETGRCRSMGIQTNGTCLTRELLEFFKKYGIQVGVSLDGPPPIHQRQRGMAAETIRGLKLLEAAGIPFRVTTVVTQINAPFLDRLVLTLAGFKCARGIGLDLLVHKGRARDSSAPDPADRDTLKEGLCGMLVTLDAVNARRNFPINLRERDLLLAAKKEKTPFFCHACLGESMAVQPDGGIFPCGQTLGDERFRAGNVYQPEPEGLNSLGSISLTSDDHCVGCPLEGNCPGDCPSRLHYNRTLVKTLTCEMYRTIWETLFS